MEVNKVCKYLLIIIKNPIAIYGLLSTFEQTEITTTAGHYIIIILHWHDINHIMLVLYTF